MFLLPSMVRVADCSVPVRSPLHPINSQPSAGVAVIETVVPGVYVPPSGVMVPFPVTDVDSV